jgi:hypothetical protein
MISDVIDQSMIEYINECSFVGGTKEQSIA